MIGWVIFILFVIVIVLAVILFLFINSDKRDVAPYDPKKEMNDNRDKIKEVDKAIDEKKKEDYNASKVSNSDIINRFNSVKRN